MRNDNTNIHCAYERSPERARIITYLTYDAYHLITFLTWYGVWLLGRSVCLIIQKRIAFRARRVCVWLATPLEHTHTLQRVIFIIVCMNSGRPAAAGGDDGGGTGAAAQETTVWQFHLK